MENINRSTLQLVAKKVPVAFIGNLKRWNVHTTHSLLKLHGSFFFFLLFEWKPLKSTEIGDPGGLVIEMLM